MIKRCGNCNIQVEESKGGYLRRGFNFTQEYFVCGKCLKKGERDVNNTFYVIGGFLIFLLLIYFIWGKW